MLRRKLCQKYELIKIEFTVHYSQKVLIHLWVFSYANKACFVLFLSFFFFPFGGQQLCVSPGLEVDPWTSINRKINFD